MLINHITTYKSAKILKINGTQPSYLIISFHTFMYEYLLVGKTMLSARLFITVLPIKTTNYNNVSILSRIPATCIIPMPVLSFLVLWRML